MRVRTIGLFGVAAVVIIALLVLLRGAITSSPADPAAPSESATTTADDSSAPAASARPGSPTRRDLSLRLPGAIGRSPAAAAPDDEPAAEEPALAPSELPNDGIPPRIVANYLMRKQAIDVMPLVEECVKQTADKGWRLTGTIMLTYIVARGPNRTVVIESNDIDHEQTTIDHAPLIECLKNTTNAMKFDYVENGVPVVAFRKVVLADGKLEWYDHESSAKLR